MRETSRQQDAQCSTDSHSQSYSLMSLTLEPSVRVYLPESLCLYFFSVRAVHDAPTFLKRAPYFRGLLVMCQEARESKSFPMRFLYITEFVARNDRGPF